MQIQVRTSINVRSSVAPPSPTDANDHYPQAEERNKAIEKLRSKSPIPLLPSLQDMAAARFKTAQRPPPGSRLSAWLHGFSVVDNNRIRPAMHTRNVSQTNTYCYHQTPRPRSRERVNGLRPATSTRGVIDPVHSPPTGGWHVPSASQHIQNQHVPMSPLDAYQTNSHGEMGYQPPKIKNPKAKGKDVQKKQGRACFPHIKDPKIRQKAIGCLLFGTILIIVLTICTFSTYYSNAPPHSVSLIEPTNHDLLFTDLALATSNTAWGTTFHGVFIFCILVLTIIFTHFLIRLCMLSFRPRRPYKSRRARNRNLWPSPTDEEAAFAQPTEPIPILLAADDELPRRNETRRNEFEDEEGSEKDLPAPPPIYGNWRGSVVSHVLYYTLYKEQD